MSKFGNWFRSWIRGPEISRNDLAWYFEQLNNPFAYWGSSSYSTTRQGEYVEPIEHSFTGYTQAAYKSNGIIFAIILARMLLFQEARFAFREENEDGAPGDFVPAGDALGLLKKPWRNGTTRELLARMEQDISLAGNFYAVNEGDRLRRLRPDWVEIILDGNPEEDAEVDVKGYMYTPGKKGEPRFYLPEQVCHWSPIPDPVAQYRGMSWLTPVIREIEADDSATRHKGAFFRNGAKPGLVVSLKETVTPEQFEKFMRTMNESHQGSDQAYKTLYLGGGADVTVAGANLQQLDFRQTQGAGETRICAAGGVPPIIVGLSEGLASATYSNYGMARRKFGDHWARPQWGSACSALAVLVDEPDNAELSYLDGHIPFLREDLKDQAEIRQLEASTVSALVNGGWTPDSSKLYVATGDIRVLEHTGLTSVQLQPPVDETAAAEPEPIEDLSGDTETLAASLVARADDDQLKHYWTRGEGLAKWAASPHPWTSLYNHLKKHMNNEMAKRVAAEWFHEVKGYWPGHQRGENPVGPG